MGPLLNVVGHPLVPHSEAIPTRRTGQCARAEPDVMYDVPPVTVASWRVSSTAARCNTQRARLLCGALESCDRTYRGSSTASSLHALMNTSVCTRSLSTSGCGTDTATGPAEPSVRVTAGLLTPPSRSSRDALNAAFRRRTARKAHCCRYLSTAELRQGTVERTVRHQLRERRDASWQCTEGSVQRKLREVRGACASPFGQPATRTATLAGDQPRRARVTNCTMLRYPSYRERAEKSWLIKVHRLSQIAGVAVPGLPLRLRELSDR